MCRLRHSRYPNVMNLLFLSVIMIVFRWCVEKDYPELKTAEDTANWVRKTREESEARRIDLFGENQRTQYKDDCRPN